MPKHWFQGEGGPNVASPVARGGTPGLTYCSAEGGAAGLDAQQTTLGWRWRWLDLWISSVDFQWISG